VCAARRDAGGDRTRARRRVRRHYLSAVTKSRARIIRLRRSVAQTESLRVARRQKHDALGREAVGRDGS
jgi:hypothetical protein